MTYEIINGWIVGKLPGQDGELIPVKHFPQGPYERRQRNNPLLCLHTTETHGYVVDLRFPTEFQVSEASSANTDRCGQEVRRWTNMTMIFSRSRSWGSRSSIDGCRILQAFARSSR